ncbi:MAG: hypothetical protein IPJ60_13155 [Sphingobacteriaceae bacterium]|nr:hypothetical protein [Sphingobacteriaceae bacterium]
MGSGKSTHGRKLASALKTEYVDLDIYITQKLNKTIHEIFENFGEQFFAIRKPKPLKILLLKKKSQLLFLLAAEQFVLTII